MSRTVVRVNFMDSRVKAFAIDSNATAHDLLKTVIEKLELKEHGTFAIFEKKNDWERCLEPDEKPADLMKTWPSEGGDAAPKFVFKKKTFIRDDDKEMEDPVALRLLFIQALANIINSEYPTSVEEAIKLAGLQVHIVYSDHNPGTHQPGFLSQNLKEYVPKKLFPNNRPADWEKAIFDEHKKHIGKSEVEAMREYIGFAKKLDFYGTTFYPPCKAINCGRRIPSKVIIGVNAEGISLLKPKDRELISSHPFTEICSWASSSTTFAFEFGVQSEATKYTFETKQGAIIAATIQTYIDILVEMLTNGNEDEEESTATGTSHGSDNDD
ncbi:Talin-1 [Balamuthia mandrillaris]